MQQVYVPYFPQGGGLLPMYVGSRRYSQAGAGMGDILRSAFGWFGRNVAPVLFRGGSEFLANAARAHASGASIKEAAKAAIHPAIKATLDEATNQLKKPQRGSGKRKRAKTSSSRPSKRRRKMSKRRGKSQAGAGRRRRSGTRRKRAGRKGTRRRVYKARSAPGFFKRPRLLTFRNF